MYCIHRHTHLIAFVCIYNSIHVTHAAQAHNVRNLIWQLNMKRNEKRIKQAKQKQHTKNGHINHFRVYICRCREQE